MRPMSAAPARRNASPNRRSGRLQTVVLQDLPLAEKAEDDVDQGVRPTVYDAEIPFQRDVVYSVRGGRHQQAEPPHERNEPGILVPVQGAVKIRTEAAGHPPE